MTDETNPNRWTAEVHMQAGTNGTGYAVWLYERGQYHGNIYLGLQADCDKLAEQINRPTPTAPADELPPGVERISDGTLWLVIPEPDGDTLAEMRLALLPDGWQWVHPNRTVEADEPVMVQVRPIVPAEPATEWVPWWEALRDELPLVGLKGKTARKAIPSGIGKYGVALIHVEIAGCEQVNLRADGMVEVLS